jgi:hypothetical protein
VTVSFDTPTVPTTLYPPAGGSATEPFVVTATTTSGGTISAADIQAGFNPGETTATVGAVVADPTLPNSFDIMVAYPAAAAAGSNTINPSITVADSLGDTSQTVNCSAITIDTLGAVTVPSLILTTPTQTTTSGWTSKPVNLAFNIGDADGDVVNYSVDWGDKSAPSTGDTGSNNTAAQGGVTVALTHTYVDAYAYTPNTSPNTATVTVTINDGHTAAALLPTATCKFSISYNTYPTATILSPQASGVLPSPTGTPSLPSNPSIGLYNPPNTNPASPALVVIPVNGMLNFSGTGTLPASGDAGLTYNWTFQNGSVLNPANANTANPGDVEYSGNLGQYTSCLVTLTVTDAFGRVSSSGPGANVAAYQKWVIVDGYNTENFILSFLYRQRSGTSAPDTYSYAQLLANGNGAQISLYQDGMNNTYTVNNTNGATTTIPVRSNVPFWLSIPPTVTGETGDKTQYLFSIPNQQGIDPDLEDYPAKPPRTLALSEGTAFAFQNSTAPWNPQLQLTTSTGFGTESITAPPQSFQGTLDLRNNFCTATGSTVYEPNWRWLDRLSVPLTDQYPVLTFEQNANVVGPFEGIEGYLVIPEWFVFLKGMETRDYNTLVSSSQLGPFGSIAPSPTGGMGFVVSDAYNGDTESSQHWSVSAMEAFRAPATTTKPYDFDVVKDVATGNWKLADSPNLNGTGNPNPSAGLNPTQVTAAPLNFLSGLVNSSLAGPLAGGLYTIEVPYDFNDINRIPDRVGGSYPPPIVYHPYVSRSNFSYAEYLWTKAWARPLVLNRTNLNWWDTESFGSGWIFSDATAPEECTATGATQNLTFPYFFYSNPSNPWPSMANITAGSSGYTTAFDLNVVNGGTFDASSPVTDYGQTGTSTGVGRFFWTAFTPHYNSVSGALISRTWLADGTTNRGQIPITFGGTTTDATTAWGFLPPQDTGIDVRSRDASGNPINDTTGGFRLFWYNPTEDSTDAPVSPDFYAVQIVDGSSTELFLLSANYPRVTPQTLTASLVTDAQTFLPSGQSTYHSGDLAGPGYCWFDVPLELRPPSGTTAYVTVFALKSILKNKAVASARVINRSEWVEAVKTVTASISTVPGGNDVSFAHKIPFNYPWDIVVVNGPATPVSF